jgi:hypothetical protein
LYRRQLLLRYLGSSTYQDNSRVVLFFLIEERDSGASTL